MAYVARYSRDKTSLFADGLITQKIETFMSHDFFCCLIFFNINFLN